MGQLRANSVQVLAQSRTLNLLYYPPTTTANFLKGSKHSRRPRFGMLASHRLMNYTTKLMASHHPQDGHTPSKIYHKEVYYRLRLWHLDLAHKIKTRWQLPVMVSHHHRDGFPPSQGWSPLIQNLQEGTILQNWKFAHCLNSQNQDYYNCHRWSATIQNIQS